MGGSTRICPKCKKVERVRPEELDGTVENNSSFEINSKGEIVCKKCKVKTKHVSEMDK